MAKTVDYIWFVIESNLRYRQPKWIIILWTVAVFFNGIILGISGKLMLGKGLFEKPVLFASYVSMFGFLLLLKGFFPHFKGIHFITNNYYPISRNRHFLMDVTNDFTQLYTLLIYLWAGLAFGFVQAYGLVEYCQAIIALLLFQGINFSMRDALTKKLQGWMGMPFLVAIGSVFWFYLSQFNIWVGLVCCLVFGFIKFILYIRPKDINQNTLLNAKEYFLWEFVIRAFYAKAVVKSNLLIIFTFKTVFILVSAMSLGGFFASWLYIAKLDCFGVSPINYFLINQFAFSPRLYRNVCLMPDALKAYTVTYSPIIVSLLFLDFLHTAFCLGLTNNLPFIFKEPVVLFNSTYILVYLVSVLLSIIVAFYFSVLKFKKVSLHDISKNKVNGYFGAAFLVIAIGIFSVIVNEFAYLWLLIPYLLLITTLGTLLFFFARALFKEKFYINYLK